ncbi:MAG: hypothetical protein ACR2PR_08755 [Pseudohongiellaceae bacterium]
MFRLGMLVAVFAVTSAVVGFGYFHYNKVLTKTTAQAKRITFLEKTLVDQEGALKAADKAIASWQEAERRYEKQIEELEAFKVEASATVRKYNEIFAKHDFGKLLNAKPGLLERRINRGSDRTWRLLHCTTIRSWSKRKRCTQKVLSETSEASAGKAEGR